MNKQVLITVLLSFGGLACQAMPMPSRSYPVSSKIRACDNFYQCVCSEMNEKFEMPAGKSRYNFAMDDAANNSLFQIKRLLNNPSSNQSSVTVQNLVQYFKSGSDPKLRAQSELASIQRLIYLLN